MRNKEYRTPGIIGNYTYVAFSVLIYILQNLQKGNQKV